MTIEASLTKPTDQLVKFELVKSQMVRSKRGRLNGELELMKLRCSNVGE
jgi:hypothetical protein